ncbi:perlucin-like [Mercenaria mercenaria]|uniref:perlucin-like n=1 Tax=Mercenaria mercenaria TaxID=6596 RepID=UPI00234F5E7E|nr:perlucin-like [Mercenaria mercenaria]
MKTLHIFILYLSFYCLDVKAIDCPAGWVDHDTSCYHFSHDTEPWMLAQMVCEGLGGHLPEIETALEDHFLSNEVKKLTGPYFWIGGSDLSVEGEWKWWTTKEALSYTNWLPSEPSNGAGNENCMSLKRISNGTVGWNDYRCSVATYYICEKQAEQTDIVG